MTALSFLPEYVVNDIRTGNTRGYRIDLLLIEHAESNGWTVLFRDNNWHNSAVFKKNSTTIWNTGNGWLKSSVINGRYEKPNAIGKDISSLRVALGE